MNKFEDYEEEVRKLVKEGKTALEIGKELEIPYTTVRSWCKRLDIKAQKGKTGKEVYNFNRRYFKDIDTEEKAYWLGFIYADGNIHNYKVRVQLQGKDKEHLVKFAKAIGFPRIREYERNGKEYCRIGITSIEMVDDLKELGMGEAKTFNMRMPHIRKDLIRHFARGFFDGDGSISNSRGTKAIYMLGLRSFIEEFNKSLKLPFEIPLKNRKDKDARLAYFQIYGKKAQEYLRILYEDSTIHLDRKKELV